MADEQKPLMELPKTFDHLISQANAHKLYERLIAQLNKDFQLANIDVAFNEAILPTSLKLLLQETVLSLIQNRFTEYLNLLYIIDVSEEQVRSLDTVDTHRLSEEVTFLILRREWQKVWYKQHYS